MRYSLMAAAACAALIATGAAGGASASTDCTFTIVGKPMTLDADCTTDATIKIPDGFTLDGAGHTITAVDPPGSHFIGAIVQNEGKVANVKNLTITTSGLADVCDENFGFTQL